MKRNIFLTLLVGIAYASVYAQGSLLTSPDKASLNWSSKAIFDTIAKEVKLDPKVLWDAQKKWGLKDDDIAIGATFWNRTKYDRNKIYQMRASGMGWGEIAHKIGMHPGEFNKMRKKWDKDGDVYEDFWRFRAENSAKAYWEWARKRNMSNRDIWLGSQWSKDNKVPFQKAVEEWTKHKGWDNAHKNKGKGGTPPGQSKGKGNSGKGNWKGG